MLKINKWIAALLIVFTIIPTGCASKTEGSDPAAPGSSPAKVTFGLQHGKNLSPQFLFGFKKGIFREKFPGVKFDFVLKSRDLQNAHTDLSVLAEGMSQSAFDFVYLTFGSALELFNYGYAGSPPPDYTIIAGSQTVTNLLTVDPSIKRLEDLDGQTVGIYNKNHQLEMLLNKLLQPKGLKTETLGGTVKVKYGDHNTLMQDFMAGRIKAFYAHPFTEPILKDAGKPVLANGSETEFGKEQTFTVLAVSNRFLKQYPDFTKEMVRIHVDNTLLAQHQPDELVALTLQFYEGIPENELKRIYHKKGIDTTEKQPSYDPNLDYMKEAIKFVKDARYLKALPNFDQIIDLSILNEVLHERGLKQIT